MTATLADPVLDYLAKRGQDALIFDDAIAASEAARTLRARYADLPIVVSASYNRVVIKLLTE